MNRKKPKKLTLNKKHKDLTPSIHFTSIDSSKDYDHMPHIVANDNMDDTQQKIIGELKDGTYVPFMKQTEYTAEIDKKTKFLIHAEPKKDSIFRATNKDVFDYKAEIEEMHQKEKTMGQTRLEQVRKQFDKTNIPIYPRYYHNPLQYFDHVLLSDGYTNSFAGTVVDMYVDFIMPKTLGPILKLRNPDKHGTPQEQQKVIEDNQEIIEKLKAVDNFYSDNGPKKIDPYLSMPIQQKFKALILNHLVFGRNALVFENWKDLPHFEWEGEKYPEIPNVVKNIQSIDMGMVEIDIYTGKLGGMYMYNSVPFISSNNMIYLINKFQNPLIGSLYYGFSVMQRAIDPVRLYRRILAQNFQQFIRSSHSGMVYFIFDSTQYPENIRNKIRTLIQTSYKSGEIGIIDYANIKDLEVKDVKITVDIQALIQLQESLIKTMIGILGMPQSLIFDEAAATRATLVGRVISFINNQISQLRNSIGEQIANQWYMRNFRILYKNKPKILEMFSIGVQFEEMDLETKTEKIERLLNEMQLNPLKDEYIGEQLNDPDYLDHIDTKKRDMQDQQKLADPLSNFRPKPAGGTFTVKDKDTSGTATVTKK